LPTFAQQKDAPDPQITEQLNALSKKTKEAFENGDATDLAALYLDDAVEVTNEGPILFYRKS
jgi:hypothetical protein